MSSLTTGIHCCSSAEPSALINVPLQILPPLSFPSEKNSVLFQDIEPFELYYYKERWVQNLLSAEVYWENVNIKIHKK